MPHESPGPQPAPPSDAGTEPRGGFSLAARRASFGHAFRGIGTVMRTQHNAWIHLGASAAVIAAGLAYRIDPGEWLAVVLAMGGVWAAEALNTAIEGLCDAVAPEHDPRIGRVKDVAAGGVLLASLAATGVAAIVFGPRLLATLAAG